MMAFEPFSSATSQNVEAFSPLNTQRAVRAAGAAQSAMVTGPVQVSVLSSGDLDALAGAFETRLDFTERALGSFYTVDDDSNFAEIFHTEKRFFYNTPSARVTIGDRFVGQGVTYEVEDGIDIFDQLTGAPTGPLTVAPTALNNEGVTVFAGYIAGKSARSAYDAVYPDTYSIGEGAVAIQFSRPVTEVLLTLSVDQTSDADATFAFYGADGQEVGRAVIDSAPAGNPDRVPVRFTFAQPVSGLTVENRDIEGIVLNDLWFTTLNLPPVAANKAFTTLEDQALTLTFADLLAGATDPEGAALTLDPSTLTQPPNATLSVDAAAQTLTLTPGANFNGVLDFSFGVRDPRGGLGTATASVSVTPVNDAPLAVDRVLTTPEDQAITLTFTDLLAEATDVDGDTLTIDPAQFALADPTQGSLQVDTLGQEVTFTPAANLNGSAVFIYGVRDGHGGLDTATVQVGVTPVNDVPVAGDDLVSLANRFEVAISLAQLLANDTDLDGDPLRITDWTTPTGNGSLRLNATGDALVYTPDPLRGVADSFTYTVVDDRGGVDTGRVSLTVPEAPNALLLLEEGWRGGDRDFDDMVVHLRGLKAQPEARGEFTVAAPVVATRYLFDGSPTVGELGVFSLEGLEGLERGSSEFRTEALNRVRSGSALGGVIVSDVRQGAKFDDLRLGGGPVDAGPYAGQRFLKTLEAGERVGLAYLRQGSFGTTQAVTKQDLYLSTDGASMDGIDHFATVTQAMGLYAPTNSRLHWTQGQAFASLLENAGLPPVHAVSA